jgi:hypothetical protein
VGWWGVDLMRYCSEEWTTVSFTGILSRLRNNHDTEKCDFSYLIIAIHINVSLTETHTLSFSSALASQCFGKFGRRTIPGALEKRSSNNASIGFPVSVCMP